MLSDMLRIAVLISKEPKLLRIAVLLVLVAVGCPTMCCVGLAHISLGAELFLILLQVHRFCNAVLINAGIVGPVPRYNDEPSRAATASSSFRSPLP